MRVRDFRLPTITTATATVTTFVDTAATSDVAPSLPNLSLPGQHFQMFFAFNGL